MRALGCSLAEESRGESLAVSCSDGRARRGSCLGSACTQSAGRAEEMQAKHQGAAVGTSLRLRPNWEWEVEGLGEPVKVLHEREAAEH